MLFVSSWSNILRSCWRDRVYWLDQDLRGTVLDLAVTSFVLVLAWPESHRRGHLTLLLNRVLNRIFFESSVLFILTWTHTWLLSSSRAAWVNVSLSFLLLSEHYTWFVVARAQSNSRAGFSLQPNYVSFSIVAKSSNFLVVAWSRTSWVSRRDGLDWLDDSLISPISHLAVSYFMFVASWSKSDSLL